jgi:hypothetical protein
MPKNGKRGLAPFDKIAKGGLGAYEWNELKQIAREIAAASCRAEGLAIARAFGLVDDELRLTGDTKGLVLEDGTTASVRILGFRHDELASGAGRAGISPIRIAPLCCLRCCRREPIVLCWHT